MQFSDVLNALLAGEQIVRRDIGLVFQIIKDKMTTKTAKGTTAPHPDEALFSHNDLMSDQWEVAAPAAVAGQADANARGAVTADRPHPGYGGRYDAKRLGRPDSRFNPSVKKNFYFVPMTSNEVVQIDGEWFFANPALPVVDEDGGAHTTVKDSTK